MYRVFAVLLMTALLSGVAGATDLVSFDYVWWHDLTRDEQRVAVQGLLAGYMAGHDAGYIHGGGFVLLMVPAANQALAAEKSGDNLARIRPWASFSKSFGSYMDEITDFYNDHPNLRERTVGEFMSCLADRPMETCDQTAARLGK